MNKRIIVIGGGISGLATLHYLRQKYLDRDDVEILLLEKGPNAGGTIDTLREDGVLLEKGPNGFLNSKKRTLQLARELGIESSLAEAGKESQIRYIVLNGRPVPIPTDLKSFLSSPILSLLQKVRILAEPFIPKTENEEESVFRFGERRLGRAFAERFLDPMVTGIYGGDAREIDLKAAFPRIHELEQSYGSLFKAMFKLRKNRGQAGAMPKGVLTSFKKGMRELIDALTEESKEYIKFSTEIKNIVRRDDRFVVHSNEQHYEADEIYASVPSYVAAELFKEMDGALAGDLEKIKYSPLVVIGLLYDLSAFPKKPEGFGCLFPSSENKKVLGMLFDSNIFPERAGADKVLLRVMIGGSKDPSAVENPSDDLIKLAHAEVTRLLFASRSPLKTWVIRWPRAIPQYTTEYVRTQKSIEDRLKRYPNLHIVANYWKGISMNDCVENAYQSAMRSVQ